MNFQLMAEQHKLVRLNNSIEEQLVDEQDADKAQQLINVMQYNRTLLGAISEKLWNSEPIEDHLLNYLRS